MIQTIATRAAMSISSASATTKTDWIVDVGVCNKLSSLDEVLL